MDDIRLARPVPLEARKLGITHGAIEVRLALVERRRAIGGGHLILAQLGVIRIFHCAILSAETDLNSG
ncbi:MAG TPA: hypothetical protein VMN38_08015 [Sphingomicrobium sp.]|nr:hypothetical protein [Sphingomicrobium sp.]